MATKIETLPVDELRDIGEKLQQSIELTTARIDKLPPCRLKTKGEKILARASHLFMNVSNAVDSATKLTTFLQNAFGIQIADLFERTGYRQTAHGIAYTGISLVLRSAKTSLNELAAINSELDLKEARENENKT